jgi:hypothetical protein
MAKNVKTGALEQLAKTLQGKASTKVAQVTEAEKRNGPLVLKAAQAAEAKTGELFAAVRAAQKAGCSFEGLELAAPALKESKAYRSAKSTVKRAVTSKVALVDEQGNDRTKATLEKLIAAANGTGERGARHGEKDGKIGKVESSGIRPVSDDEIVTAALNILSGKDAASVKLRVKHAGDIAALYLMVQGEAKPKAVNNAKVRKVPALSVSGAPVTADAIAAAPAGAVIPPVHNPEAERIAA